jgi:hypothetical protein
MGWKDVEGRGKDITLELMLPVKLRMWDLFQGTQTNNL